MNVMMAVKGPEEASFFRRAMALSRLAEAERILLAHVIDPAPHADLERGRERFLSKRPLSAERNAELLQLEEERARAILQFAHQALSAARVPDERIDEITVRGKPNDELHRLAEEHEVELIVVHGRPAPRVMCLRNTLIRPLVRPNTCPPDGQQRVNPRAAACTCPALAD